VDYVEAAGQPASEIDGWLSDREGEVLYELAKTVPPGQAIVEIRSWRGESTVCLAMGASAGNGSSVYSVDPQGEQGPGVGDLRETYPVMVKNLSNAGVRNGVTILSSNAEVAALRRRRNVGLLCMGVFQDYDAIRSAFVAWKPLLLPAAVVAVKDCDQPGPSCFVEEYLKQSDDFSIVRTIDTTIIAAYDSCVHHWVIDSVGSGVCQHCGRRRTFRAPPRWGKAAGAGK